MLPHPLELLEWSVLSFLLGDSHDDKLVRPLRTVLQLGLVKRNTETELAHLISARAYLPQVSLPVCGVTTVFTIVCCF